jgi:adenosylhomocysteinase
MDSGNGYEVRDLKLAAQGERNIEWARQHMKALMKVNERFSKDKPLKGLRVGMALHVTKETALLVETLIAGGADVAITGCNPLSTQDDIAAALAKKGVKVWAYKGESNDDYYRYLKQVIAFRPNITIDDGCDLVTEIHLKHKDIISDIIGGCEETTTGVLRLHAMQKASALLYPIIAVNDNRTKHLFDNYYGTGQSTLDGIIRATNILFAGKTVVVAGYGDCGKGVALRAKGLGAEVVVTEVEPVAALKAKMDGYAVVPMKEAAKLGDIFVTVTGNRDVLTKEHFELMKDGAIMSNSGHFDVEVDVKALHKASKHVKQVRPGLEEFDFGKKRLYLCGEGRLVNLACAEGHPSEVMSTSFCGQALSCEFLAKNKGALLPKIHKLPEELDLEIAKLQLDAMCVKFDTLTKEQRAYLASWKEGT